jgi:hypothetical protein
VTVTLLAIGDGSVAANPHRNVYRRGDTVTIAATPSPGGTFLGWSDDARGTNDQITLTLDQSKVVLGSFTGGVPLLPTRLRLSADGTFRFSMVTDAGRAMHLETSSNLVDWQYERVLVSSQIGINFEDTNAFPVLNKFYRVLP